MKNRNKLSLLKKNYFKVPNKLYEVNLSAMAILVYTYLAKVPENFNPSVGTIAKSLGLSKTTVVKYLSELKDRNIIRMIKQGGQNTLTEYEFIDIKDWK